MRLTDVYLNALGTCLPERVEADTAIADGLYEEELRLESGFDATHVASDCSALDLAADAGAEAIKRGSVALDQIGFFAHGGAYYQGPAGWPGTGYIMKRLGLGQIPSVQISLECNGLLAGVEMAIGQLTGVAQRTAALVTSSASYATPEIDRWHQAGPQSVLSDGGAAVLISTEGGFAELTAINSRTMPEAEGWARGAEPLTPPVSGFGWQLNLVQRALDHSAQSGASLQDWLDSIADNCRDLAFESLADAGITIADVARVVTFHTARYNFEEAVGEPLGVEVERSNWECGRAVGHIGPCDHIVSLEILLMNGELAPGDHVLLVSWGSGMTATTAVLRILEIPPWASHRTDTGCPL